MQGDSHCNPKSNQNKCMPDIKKIWKLKFTFFRCPWIYHARTSPGKCLHFDNFPIWQQMDLCVPFTIDLFLWHEIVVLPNQQEVVKNNTIFSSLQKKLGKKRFGAKKRSKSTFSPYKYYMHVSFTMSVLHIYTVKYSILSIFRAKQKMSLRPSRKHCSLLCVFVMKKHLLNCSSIRLDYDLLVFSSRFLLPKMKVFDIWKKGLSNFHELLESARARA